MSYSIELTGLIIEGNEKANAIEAFSNLFHCAPVDAEKLLNRAPIVIKAGLSEYKVEQLADLITETGVEFNILSEDETADPLEAEIAGERFTEVANDHEVAQAPAPAEEESPSLMAKVKNWFGF